jgi:predicted RNase H-like HicB family nuclease
LPGYVSEGETLDRARRNVREAIELYLEPVDEPACAAGGFIEGIVV